MTDAKKIAHFEVGEPRWFRRDDAGQWVEAGSPAVQDAQDGPRVTSVDREAGLLVLGPPAAVQVAMHPGGKTGSCWTEPPPELTGTTEYIRADHVEAVGRKCTFAEEKLDAAEELLRAVVEEYDDEHEGIPGTDPPALERARALLGMDPK